MKHLLPVAFAAVLLATAARAETPIEAPVPTETPKTTQPPNPSLYNSASPYSLFSSGRITFHQSYSLSYFSGPGGGQSVGMYMSSIGYQLAKPLYLQVDIGLMHDPAALVGNGDPSRSARILPNFSLMYNPSPKFSLMVDVRTMPGYYGAPYGGYMPGYGGNYWMR